MTDVNGIDTEEDFGDAEFYEDDVDSFDAEGNAFSRLEQQHGTEYEAEMLSHLNSLKKPENQCNLIEIIDNTTFLQRTKDAFKSIVLTYFSQDTVLANIENIPMALNDMDMSFSEALPHSTKWDMHNPDYLFLKSLIRNNYEILLTKTKGGKRERILQDTQRMEVLTGKYSNKEQNQPTNNRTFGLPTFNKRGT